MKKFSFTLVMLALALAFGLAFAGCKNEAEDEPEVVAPPNGSVWRGIRNGVRVEYTFYNGTLNARQTISGTFSATYNGVEIERGTYTVSEGNITVTPTQFYIPSGDAGFFNTTVGWKTPSEYAQLKKQSGAFTDDEINAALGPFNSPYSGGNTMTFNGVVYTLIS